MNARPPSVFSVAPYSFRLDDPLCIILCERPLHSSVTCCSLAEPRERCRAEIIGFKIHLLPSLLPHHLSPDLSSSPGDMRCCPVQSFGHDDAVSSLTDGGEIIQIWSYLERMLNNPYLKSLVCLNNTLRSEAVATPNLGSKPGPSR